MFHEDLTAEVSQYTHTHLAGKAREFDDSQTFPQEHWHYLSKNLRLFDCLITKDAQPRSFRTFLEAIRIISKEFASLGSILLTQGIYAIWTLEHFGTEEQKEVYLESLVSGEILGGFAFSEQDIRLKKELPQTLAIQTETGWILTGQKHMVSNASLADFLLVFARTQTLEGQEGTGIFIVHSHQEGVTVGKAIEKYGVKAMPIAPVTFDGVQLAKDSLLGNRLDALEVLAQVIVKMRLAISAQALGIAEGVFRKGLDYSRLKRGFGKRPIDVSVNQFKFSEIEMKLAACKAYYHEYIRGSMVDDRRVSMLKLLTTSTAQEVADEVVRITGAYSFIADNDIERYVHDAKVTGLYGGATDSLKRNIAQIWLEN